MARATALVFRPRNSSAMPMTMARKMICRVLPVAKGSMMVLGKMPRISSMMAASCPPCPDAWVRLFPNRGKQTAPQAATRKVIPM